MIANRMRQALILPRPTGWHLFLLLLIIALGSEYWDKNPARLGGSLEVPWPRFVLAMMAIPLIVRPEDLRWTTLLRLPRALRFPLLFWSGCALSIIGVALAPGESDWTQFLKTFLHLTMYVLYLYVLVKWMTWRRLFQFVGAYYVLGVAAAALALLQFVHGTFGVFGWMAPFTFQSAEYDVGAGLSAGFRASSIFGEPSWAARYYVHWMALALAYWWTTRRRRHLAALTLFVLAFYVANSLLGYVIFAAFVLAFAISHMWRRNMFSLGQRQKIALAAAAYVLLVMWLAGATPPVPDLIGRSIARVGLFRQGGGAAGNRYDSVWAGLEVWKLAPTFGVGLGNIPHFIVPFYQDPSYVLRSRFGSDSLYVQLLAETGVVGLLCFVCFWFRLLWFRLPPAAMHQGGIATRHAAAWLRFLQFDLLAQAVGMLNYADYLNPHLWTVVAIMLSCKTLLTRSDRPPVAEPLISGAPALEGG